MLIHLGKIVLLVSFCILIMLSNSCLDIKKPAPLGVHGHYSCDTIVTFRAVIPKDSVINAFEKLKLIVCQEDLLSNDFPKDSIRYFIKGIICDGQRIEAYLEFINQDPDSLTINLLWFNSDPTSDNRKYYQLTNKYHECFKAILHESRIIK